MVFYYYIRTEFIFCYNTITFLYLIDASGIQVSPHFEEISSGETPLVTIVYTKVA